MATVPGNAGIPGAHSAAGPRSPRDSPWRTYNRLANVADAEISGMCLAENKIGTAIFGF